MGTVIIVNKERKQLPETVKKEVEGLKNQIDLLKKRINYLNSLYNINNYNGLDFSKWYEIELNNIIFDEELVKIGNYEDYIGKGYTKEGTPIYFKKSDIARILKYNDIQ